MRCFVVVSKFEYRVRLDMPTIEVRFEHLTVEAKVYLGSRALPTLLNFAINMLQVNRFFFFWEIQVNLLRIIKI